MLPKSITAIGLAAALLLPLASCSNSPVGKSLQDALSADPRLKDNAPVFGSSTPQPSPVAQVTQAQLPANFPAEIPLYPNRALLEADLQDQRLLTRWSSPDSSDRVLTFYRQEFQKSGWSLEGQPIDQRQGTFEASREGLQVVVSVQAEQSGSMFSIQATEQPANSTKASIPQSESSDFIGPVAPAGSTPPDRSATSAIASETFTDLSKAPKELQQYVKDLAQLGVLARSSSGKSTAKPEDLFEPNKTITRREYARWLVAANNRIYASRPAKQIRSGVETSQPAFQDVSRSNSDFSAIQGLAEAGLIPSSLSGDSTIVLFRPDAPLTREEMILWKMPVDMRQSLPTATIEAVKQTWGFQDAARIDSRALRAVLADFQNGDQSNLRRAFGYTTLFQPKRSVTRAEAAAVLWYFGFQGDGISAQDALKGTQQGSKG